MKKMENEGSKTGIQKTKNQTTNNNRRSKGTAVRREMQRFKLKDL